MGSMATVENLWDPDPESRTASIILLTNPDWPQGRTHIQLAGSFPRSKVGRDRSGCSRWIQGQEGKVWRQRGDPGLALPHLARSCFHPLAHPPARYVACANLGGRDHRSSLGKGRVLEDRGRCRLDWVSRGYIYIYIYIYIKAAGSPGAGRSLRAQLCGAQAGLHSCPEAGSPFIAPGRQAKRTEEGGLERVEREGSPPSLPAAKGAPHCEDEKQSPG